MKFPAIQLSRLALVTIATFCAAAAHAHESWIDTQEYQVEIGAAVIADIRNGQEFKGTQLAYFPDNFTRFDMAVGDIVVPVPGRLGDRPAIRVAAPDGDSLLAVLYESAPTQLTYTEWDKFLDFAEHKSFANIPRDHEVAGWSKDKFGERYTRHIKALIGVGTGVGADRAYGLETEIVALANPYAAGFDRQMTVQVNYRGMPRGDAQVEIFDRAPDDTVAISTIRTDAEGIASLSVTPGHDYLLDAVVLRPAPDAGTDEDAPVWETLWAALTFGVPE